jgi:Tol biopolymer transport system component
MVPFYWKKFDEGILMSHQKQPLFSNSPFSGLGIPGPLLGMIALWLVLLVFAAFLLLASPNRMSTEESYVIPLTGTTTGTATITPHSLRELETAGTDVSIELVNGTPQPVIIPSGTVTNMPPTLVGIKTATPRSGSTYRSPTPRRYTSIPYRTSTPNYGLTKTASVITQTAAVTHTYQVGQTQTLQATQTQIAGTATAMVATQTILLQTQTAVAKTQSAIVDIQLGYSADVNYDGSLDVVLRHGNGGAILKVFATSGANNIFCDWSVGSTQAVFARRTGSVSDLIVSDLSGNETNLTQALADGQYEGAAWSPSGAWIVYQYRASSSDPFKLYAVKRNLTDPGDSPISDGPVAITSGSGNDVTPDWTPDGNWIVFSRDGQLYSVDVASLKTDSTAAIPDAAAMHTDGEGNAAKGAWPHYFGNDLVFANQPVSDGQWDLFKVSNGDWTTLANLTNTIDDSEVEPTWSGDGGSILYTRFTSVPDSSAFIEAQVSAGIYTIGSSGSSSPASLNNSGLSEYAPRWVK